jgi:hypothetical protein
MLATLPLALRWLAVMLAVVTEVCGVTVTTITVAPVPKSRASRLP